MNLIGDETTIVIRGHFNPRIFHPSWFGLNKLLGEKEVEGAVNQSMLVSDQLTQFQTDWLFVQVTADRFHARSSDFVYVEPLRDLVIGIFTLLEHTPVNLLGVNREFIYQAESREQWDAVGNSLAPKGVWDGVLEHPGLLVLHMDGKSRVDDADHLRIRLSSTNDPEFGVKIDHNEQYGGAKWGGGSKQAIDFVRVVESQFDDALAHFQQVTEALVVQALTKEEV